MSDLILYTYYRSSAAYRVRIALNLKGLTYTPVPVDLRLGNHRDERYLDKNPQGLVPALAVGNQLITQSLAICEYLDEAYPERTALLPRGDSAARAHVRSMAQLIACDIHPINNLRVLNYLTGQLGSSEEQKMAWYRHWIHEGFSALEKILTSRSPQGRFCYGDLPTLADLCLVPQVYNAVRFDCQLEQFPTIRRINSACLELPAFIDAAPEKQPDSAVLR